MKQRLETLELYLYTFFSKFLLTKHLITVVRSQYENLCPGDIRRIKRKCSRLILLLTVCSFLLFLLLFMLQPSLLNISLAIFYIFLMGNEILRLTMSGMERKILRQLEQFLLDVRHYYYTTHSVAEAILEAITYSGYEMRIHGAMIYEILISADVREEAQKYHQSTHNTFLKLFLTQCINAMEYGDQVVNGESLFVANIGNLRRDIQNRLLQIDAFRYAFSGLVMVSVLPLLALNPIRVWGTDNLPELEAFYSGKSGTIAIPVFFLLSLISYRMIVVMQEITSGEIKKHPWLFRFTKLRLVEGFLRIYDRKHYGKTVKTRKMLKAMGETLTSHMLLIKQILYALLVFLAGLMLLFFSQWKEQQTLLNEGSFLYAYTGAMEEGEAHFLQEEGLRILNEYKEAEMTDQTKTAITSQLLSSKVLTNRVLAENLAEELCSQAAAYQECYIRWQEILLLLLLTGIAYYVPFLVLLYRKKLQEMTMNLEVMQYQSILMMLIHMPEMTVLSLLEALEEFAVVFRISLQDCINDYSFSREEALENMKSKEQFEPFCRMADNFIICDRIGIEKAFDEVEQDRMHFQERQKLELEKQLRDKSLLAKIIAYTPGMLILTGYLIVPFSVECIRQFVESWSQIQAMV